MIARDDLGNLDGSLRPVPKAAPFARFRHEPAALRVPTDNGMTERGPTTGTDMRASPEFLTFGRWFMLDIGDGAPTLDEMYDFVLDLFHGEERVRLRDFIDHALREASDATLQQLWKETDADIYFFTARDLRTFLTGARDRLLARPNTPIHRKHHRPGGRER